MYRGHHLIVPRRTEVFLVFYIPGEGEVFAVFHLLRGTNMQPEKATLPHPYDYELL
jgi:hypothetical protein